MAKDVEKTRLVRRPDARKERADAGARVAAEEAETKTRIVSAGRQRAAEEPSGGAAPASGGGAPASGGGAAAAAPSTAEPVCAFLIVVAGPGVGQFRGVFNGMNTVGRGKDQRVPINFGDETISRAAHAYIVYDDEDRKFFIQHSGQANLIRLNGKPVLQSLELTAGDVIRIGRSELKFMPFCGSDFDWKDLTAEE